MSSLKGAMLIASMMAMSASMTFSNGSYSRVGERVAKRGKSIRRAKVKAARTASRKQKVAKRK